MIIHQEVINTDLKNCLTNKWYPKIDTEFIRVLRLLRKKRSLPGQTYLLYFQNELRMRIQHAKVYVPGLEKSDGARLVYYLPDDQAQVIKVLYLGGHNDPYYMTMNLTQLVTQRYYEETRYITADSYIG